MEDTKVGSAIIDTKINTAGVEQGTEEIKKDMKAVADAAQEAVKTANKAFDNFDVSQMEDMTRKTAEAMRDNLSGAVDGIAENLSGAADGMADNFEKESEKILKTTQEMIAELPDTYQEVFSKIDNILSDSVTSNNSKAAAISAQFQKLGQDQSTAMAKAWAAVKAGSEDGAKTVINNLKDIQSTFVSVDVSGFSDKIDEQSQRVNAILSDLNATTNEKISRIAKIYEEAGEESAAAWNKAYQAVKEASQKTREESGKTEKSFEALTDKISRQEKELSDLKTSYINAYNQYGKTSDEVKRLEQKIENLSEDLAKNKKAFNEAAEAADKLDDALEDIEETSGGDGFLSAVVGGLTTAVAQRALQWLEEAGEAIVEFGKQSIELGSDLEEVQNVVDVTFTTMSDKVNEFARNAAASAGLSETMAKKYIGTFGAMADSFGFTEQEAYNMSTALTQLAGDVASFYNLEQEEAYTKLKSVFTGETESLKELGVVMTQTALDAYAMEKGFGKVTSEMTEQEKVALRYEFVLEQLNAASGDFTRTQESWANQTKILSLQWESLKATVGQGLINAFTPALEFINNSIMPALQALADEFAEAFEPTAADNMASSIETLSLSFEDAQRNFALTNAEIEANADLAIQCVEQLRELEKAGLDTAEAQKAYAGTVEYLNELVPGLNLGINENTGLIDQNTDAILESIEALKQKARYQAEQERYNTALEAQEKAYAELAAAENNLRKIELKRMQIEKKLAAATGDMTEETKDVISAVMDANEALREYNGLGAESVDIFAAVSEATAGVTQETRELAEELSAVTAEEDALRAKIAEMNDALSEQTSITDLWKASMEEYAVLAQDAATQQEAIAAATTLTDEALEALETEYQEAADAARTSIDSQIGYFDELNIEAEKSTSDIINAWKSQIEALNDYEKGLQKMIQMGYPEELVKQLSDGTTESMALVDTFVNKNDTGVAQIVRKWNEMQTVRTKTAETLGKINSDFEQNSLEIQKTYDDLFGDLIQTVGEGAEDIVESFEEEATELAEVAEDVGEDIEEAFGRSFDSVESDAQAMKNSVQSSINSIQGKTVYVDVITRYSTQGTMSTGVIGSSASYLNSAAPAAYAGVETSAYSVPYLAEGAVIPPRAPFMAVLGDQRSGYNIEAPTELIRSIFREEMDSSVGNEEIADLMQTLIGVVESISVGDDTIAKAAARYNQKMSIVKGVKQ